MEIEKSTYLSKNRCKLRLSTTHVFNLLLCNKIPKVFATNEFPISDSLQSPEAGRFFIFFLKMNLNNLLF